MKFFFTFILLCSSFFAIAADKITEVFTLDHQMSQMCENKIKSNLRFEKGIKKIEVSLKDNVIVITYDSEKASTESILKAFKKIGFNAEVVKAEEPEENQEN